MVVQEEGADGEDGATFIPKVSEEGIISWTNDKGLDNPEPVNIKGKNGDTGATGPQGPKPEKVLITIRQKMFKK